MTPGYVEPDLFAPSIQLAPERDDVFTLLNPATGVPIFRSNPGRQTQALATFAKETLFGGSRGGGKSVAGTVWLTVGNLQLSPDNPYFATYLNDPKCVMLVLRANFEDLKAWIEESKPVLEPLGAQYGGNPTVIKFPSQAKIYCNHLKDEGAFEKYKGWSIWKILIEELTLIPKLSAYLKLLGSLRCMSNPYVKPQLFATTNPDGPGAGWVEKRWVSVPKPGGGNVPWGEMFADPITKSTRVFIPATVEDNPFSKNDPDYMAMLLSQDEATQAAWIHGVWGATSGTFFTTWRNQFPFGSKPRENEPTHANHVILPVPLEPWWFRWGGGDWGYSHEAAWYKLVNNEDDRRIHIYDEMVTQDVGAYEVGAQLAEWWWPDLQGLPDRAATIFLSHDAFGRRDETNSIAEQVAAGITSVLGPGSALLMNFNRRETEIANTGDRETAERLRINRINDRRAPFQIRLSPASRNVSGRASFFRDCLRWREIAADLPAMPDVALATHIFETKGEWEMRKYLERFDHGRKPNPLPRLQVWQRTEENPFGCPKLIECIPTLQRDPTDPERPLKMDYDPVTKQAGDDTYDGASYGLYGAKDMATIMPKEQFVEQRTREFAQGRTDPNILHQIRMKQAQIYDGQKPKKIGYMLPRLGSSRHRGLKPHPKV